MTTNRSRNHVVHDADEQQEEEQPSESSPPTTTDLSQPPILIQPNRISPIWIRGTFLLLGVGILIPWNAFVSAKPYFQARLCQNSKVIVDFELWFGLVWNMSSVFSLGFIILTVAFKDWWKSTKRTTPTTTTADMTTTNSIHDSTNPHMTLTTATTTTTSMTIPRHTTNYRDSSDHGSMGSSTSVDSHPTSRESHSSSTKNHSSMGLVMVPLTLYLVVFLLTDALVLIPTIDAQWFLRFTMIGLALCGTCGSIATAGIISTAGLFESHIGITPFFSGQALGGVAVAVANFMASTLESPDEFWEETCHHLPSNNSSRTDSDNNQWTHQGRTKDDSTSSSSSWLSRMERRHLVTHPVDLWDIPPPSCSPYGQLDWVVFGYFFVGCMVLAGCLVGYVFIHQYQTQEYRDHYQSVQDIPLPSEQGQRQQGPSVAGNGCLIEDDDNEVGVDHPSSTRYGRMKNHQRLNGSPKDSTVPAVKGQDKGGEQNDTVVLQTTPPYQDISGSTATTSHPSHLLPLYVEATPTTSTPLERDEFMDEHVEEGSVEPGEYTEEENELAIFYAIKGPWTTIFLVFALTLCIFPSWVSQLKSIHQCHMSTTTTTRNHRLFNDLYSPLSFVIFNVGDLCGRLVSERIPITRIKRLSSKLVAAALGRLMVFPILFLMCVTEEERRWFPVIANDIYSWSVQFFFAMTNGLLVSLSFMHAPHLVAHNTTMQERASEMMTFSVSLGLLMGSLLSFPFSELASLL